jgi:large conductance mechanosensitive channel
MNMPAPAAPAPKKRGLFGEFRDFIEEGDVITIAVGLVMALYTKAIVDSILAGIVYPIISAIFGKPDIVLIGFDIGDARISIGLVFTAIINFILVAILLFLIVKVWSKIWVKRSGGPSEVEVLTEIRDELRRRP